MSIARGTRSLCSTATVINQRVNYGSVDESIPASAKTRNIHADGFPSRVRQVTGDEGSAGAERTEEHERGETRPEAPDGRGGCDRGGANGRGEGEGGAETRLGIATLERAINDSGAEFRDAEILSV